MENDQALFRAIFTRCKYRQVSQRMFCRACKDREVIMVQWIMQWVQMGLEFLFDLFFGCRHAHLTRPFTLESRSYKICLDCGHEMPYSLESMRLLHPWEIMRAAKTPAHAMQEPVPALASGISSTKSYERWKAVA